MVILRFSKKSLPLSWLIRYQTWSRWSHVSFELPDGRVLGSEVRGGIAIREPDKDRAYERWETDLPVEVLMMARTHIGTPYGWRSYIGHLLKFKVTRRKGFNCSEYIAQAAYDAGHPFFRLDEHHKILPRNLYNSLRLIRQLPNEE